MIFNEGNKGSAATAINNAINKLKSCKSVTINIPSDFEEAGTIKSALDIIKNINLSGIKSDFESAVAGFDAAESATDGVLMGFRGLLNSMGIGNKTKQKGKKDNHDVYHQIEKERKIKNYNYNLSNQLQSGTMYNLNHLTKEQKEKINKGVEEETTRKNAFRLRSSMVNELVSVGKGLYKMGENITDFFALRAETLQEERLRTIYTSNAQYAKEHGEEYEKEIEKMREKTMSYVAKDHTETAFNKLYKENAILKEINERAYNPFKTTGVAYKVGEQTAPVIAAITVSTVTPHAASVIIPTIIGINSGGRSSEEYLRQKKQTQNNWKTKENLDNAIKYGNAIGLWDAAQYAVGMNLFKINPTGYEVVDAMPRVEIDTFFNATDTPYKAMVYSLLDKETDFNTAFEAFGGIEAVCGSIVLGLGGSVFGEVVQYAKQKDLDLLNILGYTVDEKMEIYKSKYPDCIYDIDQLRSVQRSMRDSLKKYSVEEIADSCKNDTNALLKTYRKDEIIGLKCSEVLQDMLNAREIITRKNIDGIEIKTFKDVNLKHISVSFDDLEDIINGMPQDLKSSINEVYVYDITNIDDVFWEARYKSKGFESSGAGGSENKKIIFFGSKMKSRLSSIKHTLYHEGGHCFDYRAEDISFKKGWNNAMINDTNISGKIGVSKYAIEAKKACDTNAEDFADSIDLFCNKREFFKKKFPNRYRFLCNMFKIDP